MSQPLAQPMSVDAFFAWQERQDVRYELVDGLPLRMMAGAKNRHDDIVTNVLLALGNRLRGGKCRPFTGDGAVETYPGRIRRPDVGIDCGRRDPDGYRAADPKVVVEVMSPSTRDFDAIGKLAEYQAVESLETIIYIEPNGPEVTFYAREPDRSWTKRRIYDDLTAAIPLPSLGTELALADIYEGVRFPAGPRLIFPPEE